MKLREREAESQGIVEFGANEVAGMTQHDLVTWYFDFQAERCALYADPPCNVHTQDARTLHDPD